jgi:hypothetical protein
MAIQTPISSIALVAELRCRAAAIADIANHNAVYKLATTATAKACQPKAPA